MTSFPSSWQEIRLMRSLVTSIFLYACESWTLTAELQRTIQAMEMRFYRKILHISYKDHVTNEEVRAKIQQAIGPHEDMTIVKRRKLQWYGHVSRSSGLAKTILQGTVKGGRRQGRQREWWEDNIREWIGLEFGKSQRAVENRKKWRKLVAKSSVVPQRPSRLRDWWWWWWWWWWVSPHCARLTDDRNTCRQSNRPGRQAEVLEGNLCLAGLMMTMTICRACLCHAACSLRGLPASASY